MYRCQLLPRNVANRCLALMYYVAMHCWGVAVIALHTIAGRCFIAIRCWALRMLQIARHCQALRVIATPGNCFVAMRCWGVAVIALHTVAGRCFIAIRCWALRMLHFARHCQALRVIATPGNCFVAMRCWGVAVIALHTVAGRCFLAIRCWALRMLHFARHCQALRA
jgi:hypothetical protein